MFMHINIDFKEVISMKIAIFTDHYYPLLGGITTSVVTLKNSLEARGHDVTIITVKVPGYVDHEPNIIRVPAFKLMDMRVGYFAPKDIYNKLIEEEFNIIHTHTEFFVGKLGVKLAKQCGLPLLHTSHTLYETCLKSQFPFAKLYVPVAKVLNCFLQDQAKYSEMLVVPSKKSKSALDKLLPTPIEVIPTGIPLDKFAQDIQEDKVQKLRMTLGLGADDKVIITVGRLSQEKRLNVIINEFSKLLKKNYKCKLVMIGDGPERQTLEQQVNILGISEQVKFLGHVASEEIGHYYQLGDIYVSASKVETQGLTIVEAMAASIPVVVYDDTNIQGVVMENESGWLFKEDCKLSIQLEKVINGDGVERICHRAFNIAVSLSDKVFGEKMEEIYERVCSKSYVAATRRFATRRYKVNRKRMRIN